MPSYFYHLKFELYPYPSETSKEKQEKVWIPREGSGVFQNSGWLDHKRVGGEEKVGKGLRSGGGDCGPGRAVDEESPLAGFQTAKRDWRFGRVRIESLDLDTNMESTHTPGPRMRGESSSAGAGSNGRSAGLNAATASVVGGGRVTKARFDPVEGKNTEVGWGIVHLYRDGEETVGLEREEIYAAEDTSDEDCTVLCVPAVPSYLTSSDFLGFVGEKTREQVSHFRMVMTGRLNRYMVLMKFRDEGVAKRWRKEFDGKVFTTMEPETCHVMFIKSITFQTPASSKPNTSFPELSHDPFTPSTSASTFLKPFPPPTPNLVELPTCPVCLERMDDTTGLLTILCQHVFHCDCLQKWKGSGCPVCRHTNPSLAASSPSNTSAYPYDPANPPFGSGEASLCSVCDSTEDLWICLICGVVGCGRYKGGHAKEHWKDSAHNFALEIETQHVWDYAGDMWVHRLIRDKGDSKVIELPSSSRTGGGDDMVPREKLERIGMEYTHLLTSQLESQRVYFEELVGKAVAKASVASTSAATATQRADEALSKLQTLEIENRKLKEETLISLEKDLEREKRKAEKSSEVARGFGKSLREEKKVSEGLMERIEFVNKSVAGLGEEVSRLKEENAELREENRDLLFSISAEEKIREMDGGGGEEGLERGELEGGSLVVPVVEKEKAGGGGGRKKGKGKGKV
ncbi:zf-UBP-domain-containing protein [Mollisia scopiformis]|uniref:Zf-UBP-domain-containing protein n=1 Tax=Mollisia scopiformis TaxID=149040 RepID=A0A194XNP2_MOLSC|nr:zf-UBP-domain-containing protein [Mollisia scopiformis]KUJ21776.1 zf-UBP-domain-containing protein [Mollisia scopiformis]